MGILSRFLSGKRREQLVRAAFQTHISNWGASYLPPGDMPSAESPEEEREFARLAHAATIVAEEILGEDTHCSNDVWDREIKVLTANMLTRMRREGLI